MNLIWCHIRPNVGQSNHQINKTTLLICPSSRPPSSLSLNLSKKKFSLSLMSHDPMGLNWGIAILPSLFKFIYLQLVYFADISPKEKYCADRRGPSTLALYKFPVINNQEK